MKSKSKKKTLLNIFSDLKFLSDAKRLHNDGESIVAAQGIALIKAAIVKKKNKAIAKYL